MSNMIPVASSNIASIGYDPDSYSLTIQFRTGQAYRYSNVPQEEYDDLMNAPSKGRYFQDFIKDVYPAARV